MNVETFISSIMARIGLLTIRGLKLVIGDHKMQLLTLETSHYNIARTEGSTCGP